MSLKASNKIETNVYELEITISGEDFRAAVLRVYNKKKTNITVPGFRKGKAPKHIIETMYGKGVFYDDALESLYPASVDDAVKEAQLDAVNISDLEIKEIGDDGVEMTVRVTVKPEIEVTQYKGLEAAKRVVEVTDEEVDSQIARMRERNATITDIEDRPAKLGDTAAIDYDGSVDGVPFDGGKGSHDLELGSGSFIPGFEEQVVGHSIGEEFDVNVTFPEEYHAEELSGKDAVFHCKINGLKEKILPELDDEFAKDVSEDADTLDELKANIKADLLKEKQGHADADFEQALLVELADRVEGEIPEVMYERKAEENKENFSRRIGQQGIDLDMYLMYMGIEKSQFEQDMYEQAVQQVKVRLALEKIAQTEGIEVTDEDVEAEYNRLAETYGVSADSVKSFFTADSVKNDILCEKAINIVKENAVVKEADEAASTEDDGAAE
ncbi:MAG: trigger factor [Clostridia bacterium]|nr:trigger factor [Clostridia bacterium]